MRIAPLSRLCAMALMIATLVTAGAVQGAIFQTMKPGGVVDFVIQNPLEHPFYWWPQSLLNYPLAFESPGADPRQLSLVDTDTGKPVPFQLSETKSQGGLVRFAIVSFLSDLPRGSHKHFQLRNLPATDVATTAHPLLETSDADGIIVDTGAVKVRMPNSQAGGDTVPGPIMQMNRGDHWLGGSVLVTPHRKVTKIETLREESGPLFVQYRITYTFDNGGSYTAQVRCVAGQDFVPITEQISGLSADDGVYVDQRWTNFHPTHRQAPNHPFEGDTGKPGYERFAWETIDNALVSTHLGVTAGITSDGELPFRLGPYQAWGAYVDLNYANFWDERSNDAVGLFITDGSKWQDHEYALWESSDKLEVRYFFKDGQFSWRWPLITGTRSTAIACYDHAKDIAAMADLDALSKGVKTGDGDPIKIRMGPTSYAAFLSIRFGTLPLDTFKDWVLEYPENAKRPPILFASEPATVIKRDHWDDVDADALINRIWHFPLITELLPLGVRQNAGYSPVPTRDVASYVASYNRLYPTMTPAQRKKIEAMFLMLAYVDAGEEVMPMRTMLAGHPNFLTDIKSVPALMVMLFPEHPMAHEWADEFERFLDLNTRYHTRPPVTAWDDKGGRWTENLSTYVWASMEPAMRSVWALRDHFDSRNRFANEQTAQIGDWLVNSLTAPFDGEDLSFYPKINGVLNPHFWGIVTKENGPSRVDPPQGAHSARRMPRSPMWFMGTLLQRFDPLVAEHLMWATKFNTDDGQLFQNPYHPWSIMLPTHDNRGTNPHLKSSKYTGYGVTLRAAVDTPKEISIHLQQIDSGPNYRWGIASEGGCGVMYYYAAGKSYSHNGTEDVGDRSVNDTDFSCNFGVFKDGHFKAIGRNVLDQPLYDLATAQLAEIRPAQSKTAYAWPEYQSRRVMLVGSDYAVVYDAVFSDAIATRFAWFVHDNDQLPSITVLKDHDGVKKTELAGDEVKGVWYDGQGDSEALITHLPDVVAQRKRGQPFATVKGTGWTDHLYLDAAPLKDAQPKIGIAFQGTAGVIRQYDNGQTELSLFHGTSITGGGVTISTADPNLGISASFDSPTEISGTSYSREGKMMTLRCMAPAASLYIDGIKADVKMEADTRQVLLPSGRHLWQLTSKLPTPMQPRIDRTEDRSGATTVFFSQATGAQRYRVELSSDNAKSWSKVGETPDTHLEISQLTNGSKVHVRVVAVNDNGESQPSNEYPIYVSDAAPLPPDGLKLAPSTDKVALHWGQVLGVTEYRLYVRKRGSDSWQNIYHGPARQFTDTRPGVIPAFDQPGTTTNEFYSGPGYPVFEYAISSVNGNGEGPKCMPIDTDPTSWLNWDPRPGEGFRRLLTTMQTPFAESDTTQAYYPK